MVDILLYPGFYTSQVVQDFFHQQYYPDVVSPKFLSSERRNPNSQIFVEITGILGILFNKEITTPFSATECDFTGAKK